MADFNIERFMELSKRVDLSDIDWALCAQLGLTDEEARIVRFMADTETHTIIYLRDLLAGHSAQDIEVISFMSCWVYEETFHGRALDRVLEACGRGKVGERYAEVTKEYSWREEVTGALSRFGAYMSPHFAAAHMCWGAINEMTAAGSYMALARRTKNTELAKLITRLAKDERKHFSFYFHQAEKRLKAGGWKARWLVDTTVRNFWKPVGIGVGEPRTLEFIASYLYGDERGKAELRKVDETIAALPGMDWFKMTSEWQAAGQEWYRQNEPEKYAQHREWDRTLWAASAKEGKEGEAAAA